MAAAEEQAKELQKITTKFDKLESNRKLSILKAYSNGSSMQLQVVCKCSGIESSNDNTWKNFQIYLKYYHDDKLPWPSKQESQLPQQQPEVTSQEFLIANKNDKDNNKTTAIEISTIIDITNNTEKLVKMLDKGTKILKEDKVWKLCL